MNEDRLPLFDTQNIRRELDWLAPDPTVIPWDGVACPLHRTKLLDGITCVAAKTEEGRTICTIGSAAVREPIEALSSFVRFAPAGVCVIGVLTDENTRFHGYSVLGTAGTTWGGSQRWAQSSIEDHFSALVKWGVLLAQTQRLHPMDNSDDLAQKLVEECVEDTTLFGSIFRTTGLGQWMVWRPVYQVDLITQEGQGLVTSEGYPVSQEYHGFAGGYRISTTYRGVRKGRITERGDIVTSSAEKADDLHVDKRFVQYWHGPEGQSELRKMSELRNPVGQ